MRNGRSSCKANGIDAAKVTIENIAPPVREPMLAAGQVDAITGLSFSSFIDLKDKGVPVDDIVVLLMADYGVDLYGNAIIVNTEIRRRAPRRGAGLPARLPEGPEANGEIARRRGQLGAQAQRRGQEGYSRSSG